jgi:hypothetical protein
MGCDTKGYIKRTITAMDIYNVICDKFDKDAIFDVKVENRFGQDEEIGFMYFKYKDKQRSLFTCYGVKYEDSNLIIDFDEYIYLSNIALA